MRALARIERNIMKYNVPILEVDGLTKWFSPPQSSLLGPRRHVQAITNVGFSISRGEVVGLVGESGSGKSTLAQTILRLHRPDSGSIRFDGVDLAQYTQGQLRPFRRRMQMVFQDPNASLNPRLSIEASLSEPLSTWSLCSTPAEKKNRDEELLHLVGLPAHVLKRYPHEFSGGQRQRISIARALAVQPDLLVADEPVSALDVSVQAQIIELLNQLRDRLRLSLLFISHDLKVIGYLADRVVVMYLGRVMEVGPTREIFKTPKHPYTRALLSAIPSTKPRVGHTRIILKGDVPDPAAPPSGCVFRTRCPVALTECSVMSPTPISPDKHSSACIRNDIG